MSRFGEQMARSTYAPMSWDAGTQTAQGRLSRRDRLEWCNRYGYNLDDDERSPDNDHPASKPLPGGKNPLQTLTGALKNKIYAYLAENVHVVGISDRDANGEGGVTCTHPLAYVKAFRSEFLGWIESNRLNKITNYVARVKNFDFETLVEIIKANEQFEKGLGTINIHIYLDFVPGTVGTNKLLRWIGGNRFVKSNSEHLNLRYAVGSMPTPEHRDKFLCDLFLFSRNAFEQHPLLRTITAPIKNWWDDGFGVDDWTMDEAMHDADYDPEEEAEETTDDFNYDHNMDDDGNAVMEDFRNHDDILGGRKELARRMGMDERICDPDEWDDPAREDATPAQQDHQRLKLLSKQYDNIYKCFGFRSHRHRFATNTYLDD